MLLVLIVLLLHINPSLCLGNEETANVTKCLERERDALLEIKGDLTDNYGLLSIWWASEDCCRWNYVYCDDQTGHVIRLDLGGDRFRFKGKLSPKLIELQHLEDLDLNFFNFNGSPIPDFIGSLTNLRNLDLSAASLGGQIPHLQLRNLTRLELLNLRSNHFSPLENLTWLTHLSSLKYLDLSLTNLSTVTDWLEIVNKLPNLRNLSLEDCSLPPPIISTVSNINSSKSLAHVALLSNDGAVTSSTWKWLFKYNTTLVHLNLGYSQLNGSIPNALGNMTSLAYLILVGNHFERGIPYSFSKLCSLQSLDISDNKLSGLFSEFVQILSTCAQSSLQDLDLGGNHHIAGSIPNLTNFLLLRSLFLSGNQLSGRIPESIGQLSKLENLDVSMNSLEGVISEKHFSKLSMLYSLDLSYNSLVLDIHSDWIPPFKLRDLKLNSCKMGPHIPQWLRTQDLLSYLSISDAGISDVLPPWFWDLSLNKLLMDLSCNQIRGALPNLMSDYQGMYPALNLSWNQLEGPIPSFLSKTSSLDLSHNRLTKLVNFLCASNVSYLNLLDLSSNHLSGELPDCWRHFGDLVFVDLSNNTFSGKIPSTMGYLLSVETIKLNGNRFEKNLPSSLRNCSRLEVFDVGENKLSGPLPEWLGVSLPYLGILILRANHFSGSMPSQLCHLTSIRLLDVSMNNISGSIPKCLNNLTTLAEKGNPSLTLTHSYTSERFIIFGIKSYYEDEVYLMWKGIMSKYQSTLGLVKSMDLSSNTLTGEIPSEMTDLVGLVSLNLSRNNLTGQVTPKIGKLQSLQSLDLSKNNLQGILPTSLFQIYGLGYLNLSNNNLSGKIPIGSQLQNYDLSSFVGNPQLCGLPLDRTCSSEEKGPEQPEYLGNQEDNGLITDGFYISMGIGFVVGFWGVCFSLIFSKSWRYAYYKFLNGVNDWIYVRVALIRQQLKDICMHA